MSSNVSPTTLTDGVPSEELHRALLLKIVAEAGEICASKLHDRYDALAHQWYYGRLTTPVSHRVRSEELGRLASEEFIDSNGMNSGRVYSVQDVDRVDDHLSEHLGGGQR